MGVLTRLGRAAAFCAAGIACASCEAPDPDPLPRTLRVAVSTDLATETEIDAMRITVERGGSEVFAKTYDQAALDALPDSLLLSNAQRLDDTGSPILTPIAIHVTALLADQVVVERTAELVFQNDEAKLLRLPLCAACKGVTCEAGETCVRGTCSDASVNIDSLPGDGEGVELAGECAAE